MTLTLITGIITITFEQSSPFPRLCNCNVSARLNLITSSFTRYCTELREIIFAGANLSEECLNYLVINLTPNLKKIDLSEQRNLHDCQIIGLVKRCTRLSSIKGVILWGQEIRALYFRPGLHKITTFCYNHLGHSQTTSHQWGEVEGGKNYMTHWDRKIIPFKISLLL